MAKVSALPDPAAGFSPPGYDVLFELGSGGMGTAALARTVGPGGFERLVVIKRLKPELAHNAEALSRFEAEARLAATIHHANVVATQQIGRDAGGPYLVLDYVEGASLEQLVDRSMLRGGPLPVPIVLRVALDALSGLAAVHEARDSRGRCLEILHRDVSLQNVLVGRDGVARVSDFGIAKSPLGSVETAEGFLVGKLQYLAPEYLRRERVGPPMDIYAVGVTLWIALSGEVPWPDATEAQTLRAVLDEGLPRLSQVAPAIEALVSRACARDPSARFASARAMAEAIESLDRETGWMARHSDVADWLEGLAGRDLEQRRELIATLLRNRRTSLGMRGQTSRSTRRWLTPALAGLALFGVGTLVALAAQRGAPQAPSANPVLASQRPAAAEVELPSPTARPAADPRPTVASSTSSTTAGPAKQPPPVRPISPKRPSPPAVSRTSPTPAPSNRLRAPQVPDDIQLDNPYKRP